MQANTHGFPTFADKDVLTSDQIKAYFGKQNSQLIKLLNNKGTGNRGRVIVDELGEASDDEEE